MIKEYDVLCTSDKESIDFLKRLHDEKMNQAALDAGLKKYSLGAIIKRSSFILGGERIAEFGAGKKDAYRKLEEQIKTSIRVNITHL